MSKRRTNPSFLSDAEAARDSERTSEMVRGICGESPISRNDRSITRRKQVTRHVRYNPIRNVGESKNFVVEYNHQDKRIAICGKEFFGGSPLKLRFNVSEAKAIINLLARARNMMENKPIRRISETNNFVVEYEGNQRLIMVYEKATPKSQFKLAINESEVTVLIDLLAKARSLF